ncbi:glutathione S-transferase [Mycena olivaceomarginata]|nr:glutathione S-transferase [Mycena olivaceomarginata]
MVLKYCASSHLSGGGGIVALVLVEKQILFEHVRVDMAAKEHKMPEFLAMHPFGQVPVIDDDGFILYESRAICRYLADKYADQGTPGLFPKDLKERALVEQAASVEFADFYPALLKVLVAKMQRDVPADQQAAVDKALAEFTKTLQVYEGILGKQKFLAGDQVTLADIFHLIYAPLLAENGVDIMTSTGPNLARWWNELISRPAWVKLKAEGIQSTV